MVSLDLMNDDRMINPWNFFVDPWEDIKNLSEKIHIIFNFMRRTIMAQMDVFNSSQFHRYIDWGGLSNIAQITFGLNILNEYKWLRSSYDIIWNQWLEIILYQLVRGKERRSMVIIFPRNLI